MSKSNSPPSTAKPSPHPGLPTGVAFHAPVGHGGFSLLYLCVDDSFAPFVLAYDCGSKRKGDIDAWVEQLSEMFKRQVLHLDAKQPNPSKQNIDLLVISHFDADHVKGIPSLLARFNVRCVMLSEPDPIERLFLLRKARTGRQPRWFKDFVLEPSAWLTQMGIPRIVNVSQPLENTDGRNDDEERATIPDSRIRLPGSATRDDPTNLRKWRIRSGQRLDLGTRAVSMWELRPVVGPASDTNANFAKKLNQILGNDWRTHPETALDRMDKTGSKGPAKQLRELSKSFFGSSNESSLMVVVAARPRAAGAIQGSSLCRLKTVTARHIPSAGITHDLWHGCVLTGDAKLNDGETLRRLVAALNATSDKKFDALVIPHHGSGDSFDANAFRALGLFAATQSTVGAGKARWIVPDKNLDRWEKAKDTVAAFRKAQVEVVFTGCSNRASPAEGKLWT